MEPVLVILFSLVVAFGYKIRKSYYDSFEE